MSTNQIIRAAKQSIKNNKLPTCSSCIFYQENIITPLRNSNAQSVSPRPFISTHDVSVMNGQRCNNKKDILCTKFGTKNIISGTIIYDKVYIARFDNDKCGEKGEHYMEKYPEYK
jgi:hypothetical protein